MIALARDKNRSTVTDKPPNQFFYYTRSVVDRMRALYWLLLLLVTIGVGSGTKRVHNAAAFERQGDQGSN